MEGTKQCPECKCTDVPINAEQCPFCGHSFGGQTKAEPAGAGRQSEVKPIKTEKKPETTEFALETDKEPAKPKPEEEDKSTVSEGTAVPVSSDFIIKEKGRKKRLVPAPPKRDREARRS